MSFLSLLWLPILVSAVVVFVLSAASHMLMPWRRTEFRSIPRADAVQSAIAGLPPGQYLFPAPENPRERMTKASMERWAAGPSGWLTLVPKGPMNMPRNLLSSFVAYLAISLVVAYVGAHALGPAAPARQVFRVVGAVGFLTFAGSGPFTSIWYARPWRAYLADAFDALVFALAMGAVFALHWPR